MPEINNLEYDGDLQMYKEQSTLKRDVLLMWRKAAESGRLGRKPEGRPSGDLALAVIIATDQPVEASNREEIIDRLAETGDY